MLHVGEAEACVWSAKEEEEEEEEEEGREGLGPTLPA